MIDINSLFRWPVLLGSLIVIAAVVALLRRSRARSLYCRREWLVLAKLSFLLAAAMLLIAAHNATLEPGAQFIYGRF